MSHTTRRTHCTRQRHIHVVRYRRRGWTKRRVRNFRSAAPAWQFAYGRSRQKGQNPSSRLHIERDPVGHHELVWANDSTDGSLIPF